MVVLESLLTIVLQRGVHAMPCQSAFVAVKACVQTSKLAPLTPKRIIAWTVPTRHLHSSQNLYNRPISSQSIWPVQNAYCRENSVWEKHRFQRDRKLSDNGYRYHRFHDNRETSSHYKICYMRRAIMLLLLSSGALSLWLARAPDPENRKKKALIEPNHFSQFMRTFIVEAAKPLNDDLNANSNGAVTAADGKCRNESRRQRFNFIADVLDIVQDAVVCIEVKDHSTNDWFGLPQVSSNGSGFIVKDDGLILTNAHVVASHQRNSITVKLQDGRCFAGFVEDVDYESDLATVRVKARGLPTLELGCSAETRIGEWVVAVGSPLNLSNTVTAGVVSSTSRGANELGINNDIKYIQTDASITFGNSGGPLINLDGEAIGINSMKVTPGISFAIPIDHAKKFLERAELRKATGKAKSSRRYMGLTILTLTEPIRKELESRTGVSVSTHGVFVWQVVQGGPAYLSGLQPGDIIVKINGHHVNSAAQVHEIIKTDDKLKIQIERRGKAFTLTVVPENILDHN